MLFTLVVDSPVGLLHLAENGEAITHLGFDGGGVSGERRDTPLLRECARQLASYFDGRLRVFDLPLAPSGTPFQLRVWRALLHIPYGETWSYKELAEAVDSPKGFRAVGMANNRNPISIIQPCHRVIGADGSLTGYGGGLEAKAFLLRLEGREVPPTL